MAHLKRGLIVSCQEVKGEPLYGYGIMHLFAKAAKQGGATGSCAGANGTNYVQITFGE